MKTLKLRWKRCNPKEPANVAIYGDLQAIYEARGKLKIAGAQVNFRTIQAVAVNLMVRAKGTSPWQVTVRVGDQTASHGGKTFTEVKNLAFQEIQNRLEAMEKEAMERAALIDQIEGIYKQHEKKPNGDLALYPTSQLKKHLNALEKGKFPWKMPPREFSAEGISEEPPATVKVVRIPVPESMRDQVLAELKTALERCVQEKGDGAFVSIHELRGALYEEWDELTQAMDSKDIGRIEAELIDWIVGGVFGLACIRAGALK